jgi:hypothetical protein
MTEQDPPALVSPSGDAPGTADGAEGGEGGTPSMATIPTTHRSEHA